MTSPHIFLSNLCEAMGFSAEEQIEVVEGVEKVIIGKLIQGMSARGDMQQQIELLNQTTGLSEQQLLQLSSNPAFVQLYQTTLQAVVLDWLDAIEPTLPEEQKNKAVAFLQSQSA